MFGDISAANRAEIEIRVKRSRADTGRRRLD
jgi:hypothetical protein